MLILFKHQHQAVQMARLHPRFYFAWEPGAGKTIASYAIIDDGKQQGFAGRTLVLAPLSILWCAWQADAQHFPTLTTAVVYSKNPTERRKLIQSDVDVLITNYDTFRANLELFENAGVTRLIVDEASKAKAPTTQITKAIAKFSRGMKSVYMLSGTPAANGAHEWIPQIQALAPNVFGQSYWQAMYRYFVPLKYKIGGNERIVGWRQIGDNQGAAISAWQTPVATTIHPLKSEFLEKLKSVSWSLKKSECLDLPEQTDVVREVELGSERKAYDDLLATLKIEFGDVKLRSSVQARAMKLRQITGGAFYHDGDATVLGTSKLDALREVLEEIGPRPCIIWAEFTNEINRIASACGPDVRIIDGNTPIALRTEAVQLFQSNKLMRIVAHPAAAGHGITLTAASHAIYYSHGYSYETYQQSRDRIHRAGQRMACTYWHLIAKDTIDAKVMKCLSGKRDAHSAIFDELGAQGREKEMESGHGNAEILADDLAVTDPGQLASSDLQTPW